MSVGHIYEVAAYCRTDGGQNQVNVTHWRVEAVAGAGLGLQEIADEMSQLWGTAIIPLLPATTQYQGVKFRRAFPNPSNVIQSDVASGAGTLAGEPMPSHVSFLISRRASTAPVFVRGRTYLPSPDEAANGANGNPSAGYRAAVIAAFDTILQANVVMGTAPDTVTLRHVIYRRDADVVAYPVDSLLYRTLWSGQMRRRPISRPDVSVF